MHVYHRSGLVVAFLLSSGISVLAAEKHSARPGAPTLAPALPQPLSVFAEGEFLTYTAKLNELPAGDAVIRLRRDQQEGRNVYRVVAQGRTNEMIDFLLPFRGDADGVFAANGGTPIAFRLTYTERDRPRELDVRYDPETQMLIGTAKKKDRAQEQREPVAGLYDPLSAFYILRSQELSSGSLRQVNVFTGKERYQILAHVVRKETILLNEKEQAVLRLHLEGFRTDDGERKNAFPAETTLWVSPDALHVPLKLESVLPFGVFVVELTGR